MGKFLKILLIILLCIDDCFLEIDDRNFFKDVADDELQAKDYQSYAAKSKNIGAQGNEYQKLGLLANNLNGEHKSSYAGARSKFRMRHSRNGKNSRKRRVQDMEGSFFEYPEKRNQLKSNERPDSIRQQNADQGLELDKHKPTKKHIAAKRWPLKRKLKKFHAARLAKSDYQEAVNEDDSCDYDDANFEHKGSEISKLGSYILAPGQNELVVLKNLNFTKELSKPENENFDGLELAEQNLVLHVNGAFDGLSKENETNQEATGNCNSEPETAKSNCDNDGDDEYNPGKNADNDENLKQKVKEEILNCTNAGLEKYLKLFGKNIKSSTGGDYSGLDKSDLMHLNITIHGTVMNNDKASKIHGNGTIKVDPNVDEERIRRALKVPFLQKFKNKQREADEDEAEDADDEAEKPESKKQCKQPKETKECKESKESKEPKKSKEEYKEPEECKQSKEPKESNQKEEAKCEDISNPDAGLTPDKLSNEIVKMVSHMVRSNPKMKTLWPSLRRNRPTSKGAACNLRTTANCSSRKQIEDMLRKAMSSVNDIIEKEVQSRSCVPLSEDLAEFYEVILQMHAKQAKRKEEREEMLIQAEKLDKESTETEEQPKGKHCKSKSKRESQSDLDDLEDNDELYDLMHLRRLQYDREIAEERRRREAEKRTHELILDTANSSLVRKLREMYSPAFLKLNSVVESLQRAEVVQEQL